MEIIPGIIADNFEDVMDHIRKVEGLVDTVQIDVVDGIFAEPPSWPHNQMDVSAEINKLRDADLGVDVEIHLMEKNPEEFLDEWIDVDPKRIYVHFEASDDIENALMLLDMSSIESGLSVNFETEVEDIEHLLERVDAVQFMSIREIGAQGNPFEESVLEKVETLREIAPDVTIQLDGGINENTVGLAHDAGVDRCIAGSAIYNSYDIPGAVELLQRE